MARRPQRKRRSILWLVMPIVLTAGAFAVVADNPLAAGGMGAIVGLFIGVALLAFPNLDRGGPADTDSTLM